MSVTMAAYEMAEMRGFSHCRAVVSKLLRQHLRGTTHAQDVVEHGVVVWMVSVGSCGTTNVHHTGQGLSGGSWLIGSLARVDHVAELVGSLIGFCPRLVGHWSYLLSMAAPKKQYRALTIRS